MNGLPEPIVGARLVNGALSGRIDACIAARYSAMVRATRSSIGNTGHAGRGLPVTALPMTVGKVEEGAEGGSGPGERMVG